MSLYAVALRFPITRTKNNSLGKALSCFSMTMPPFTKRGPYRNCLLRSGWKNLLGLHRALTSTPSNTFGRNWNADCEPCLIAKHHWPTSLMLVAEWKQIPAVMFQHLEEILPWRVEAVIAGMLLPMILEWDVQRAGVLWSPSVCSMISSYTLCHFSKK